MRSCGPSLELGRQGDAENDRLVGNLHPPLGEQRRERGLARAAHSAMHVVRLLEVPRLLAVVALVRELHGFDAAEVFVGQREHAARRVDGLPVQERRQLADERADEVERFDLQLVALRVDVLAQLGADDCEDDQRSLPRCGLQHRGGGLACPHARVQPDVRARVGELQHRGAHDLLGRLARRVAQDFDASSVHVPQCVPARDGATSTA